MTKAYCVKCKKKVKMINPKESIMKNGHKIAKGKCPNCKETICGIGGFEPPIKIKKEMENKKNKLINHKKELRRLRNDKRSSN